MRVLVPLHENGVSRFGFSHLLGVRQCSLCCGVAASWLTVRSVCAHANGGFGETSGHFLLPFHNSVVLLADLNFNFFFLLFYCFEKDSWHVTQLITNPPCSCSKLPLHCWAAEVDRLHVLGLAYGFFACSRYTCVWNIWLTDLLPRSVACLWLLAHFLPYRDFTFRLFYFYSKFDSEIMCQVVFFCMVIGLIPVFFSFFHFFSCFLK